MRSFLRALRVAGWVVLAALLPACSGSESGGEAGAPRPPTPKEEAQASEQLAALAAHDAFLDALRAGDAGRAASFLDSSPELLLFPVAGRARLEGPEEASLGLEAMLRGLGPAEWTVVHLRPSSRQNAVWMTYLFAVEAQNRPEPLLGRGTEIWVRREGAWKLLHGHWSQEPGGN